MGVYNREAVMDSMRTHMAKEVKDAPAADNGKSADSSTTAEDQTSEKAASGSPEGEKGGDEGTDQDDGSDGSGSDTDSEGTTAGEGDGTSTSEQALEGEGDGEDDSTDDESEDEDKAKASAGKLDEDEQKAVEAWLGEASKKLPVTPETRKLLKIAKDNHAAVQAANQEIAVKNDYLAAVGNAVVNHDVETLNAMAEELGGEKLPFDLRTEEDQIKEHTESYNTVFDALEASLKGTPEVWAAVQRALSPVQAKTQKAIDQLEKKIMVRQASDEAVKKVGGKPVKAKYLEEMESKADKNFTALFKADAKAKDNMEILKPLFKKGTVFQTFAKAYAMAPNEVNELGEALDFKRNFQAKYYPELKKKIEAELKLRRNVKAPPSGKKSDSTGAGDPQKSNSKETNRYNAKVGSKLMERFGRRR
jgi:hypothetical protein